MSETTPLSVFEPAGDATGGIVVIQEIFGVNDHIEDVCRRLAAEGWLAVAPHLFHRSGDPKLGYEAMDEGRAHAQELTADGVLADVDAAFARLAEAGIPRSRTGIVGFCMGGSVALVTAVRCEVGAAVTFYGGGVTEGRFGFGALVDEAPGLQAPWLGLYGDLDRAIPIEGVEELRIVAARSGQPTEIVRYPEAGHGFNCDQRDSYHEPSATDAWRRMLEWFDHHLG
jgi:carboxymethylenebutenolidase